MSNISKAILLKRYKKQSNSGLELLNLLFFIVVLACSILIISTLGQIRTYAQEVPTEDTVREILNDQGENSKIYDRNGELLYTFKDPDRDREYAEFDEIPDTVIAAALAAEDRDFFIHEGIDYLGMAKGLSVTLTSNGDTKAGGSTITQQLVKQTLLTTDRTYERKAKEAILTLFVERDYEKKQILEYYLNVTPYGGRVIGIKTAAKTYFNKDLKDLSLEEAVFLVSLVQSPGEYSPLFANDTELAEEKIYARMENVFDQFSSNPKLLAYLNTGDLEVLRNKDQSNINIFAGEDSGKYTYEKIEQLKDVEFEFQEVNDVLKAPHWVFYIRDLLNSSPYNLSINDLYSGGYKIYTSLDLRVQDTLQKSILEGVNRWGGAYGFENSSAVMSDPRTGDIIAMVGSKGYDLENDPNNDRFDPQVNVALSNQLLGSSLKPWVYYLGFQQGGLYPGSEIKDTKQTFYGGYTPKNYDGRFMGEMSVRKALLDSRNLPAVKTLYKVGDWKLGDLMTQIGYREENSYGLAASLGGVDESLLDHTGAYTGFANGGSVMKKRPVLRILDRQGEEIYKSNPEVIFELDRRSVSYVNNILGDKSYQPFTYYLKFINGNKLAGKTGTSDSNKDTYYMGYSPKVVLGVWAGNNDNTRMSSRALGSTTALRIWNLALRDILVTYPEYNEWGRY